MFAAICLDLSKIPANLLSLGALDFGMLVDGSVVMIENIVRHLANKEDRRKPSLKIQNAAHEVQRPVFLPELSSLHRICPFSRCRRWRGASSSRWRGRLRSRCWAR